MPIKGDGFLNAESFHHDETGSITERIRLVFVSPQNDARLGFILRREALDTAEATLDAVKKSKGIRPTIARPIQKECIRFEDHSVRCD